MRSGRWKYSAFRQDPGKIEYDITKLELGQSVHVSDLKFEEGIKVLTDPGDVIVTVLAPAAEAALKQRLLSQLLSRSCKERQERRRGRREEGEIILVAYCRTRKSRKQV